jgi:hypothetical protein
MQLVDSELYVANVTTIGAEQRRLVSDGADFRCNVAKTRRSYAAAARGRRRNDCSNFIPWLKATSASERLLALLLAAFVLTASPALIATVRSVATLSFQILLQAGHVGFIAFQIFGR